MQTIPKGCYIECSSVTAPLSSSMQITLDQSIGPSGIYPMLYAFFRKDGGLDRGAMSRQVNACVANGAHGVAVLGLATEVAKLSDGERHQLVEWVAEDLAGRLPLAVTIYGDGVASQIEFAQFARRNGAGWVILQPPRISNAADAELVPFFARVIEKVDLPVAIQNAPEYIGIGLTDDGIAALAQRHSNFRIVKAEGSVLAIRRIIDRLGDRLRLFNGRAGLELTDNLRAGCAGMIPGTDLFDLQARCFDAMSSGDELQAERLYAKVLPAIVFAMQSVEHLVCYGKRLAALRLGIGDVYDRVPSGRLPFVAPTEFGLDCIRRYAAHLGPLN